MLRLARDSHIHLDEKRDHPGFATLQRVHSISREMMHRCMDLPCQETADEKHQMRC